MKPKKPNEFKVGDFVTVVKIPRGLKDTPDLQTLSVFRRALKKTFPIKGFDHLNNLELTVAKKRSSDGTWDIDTIWIEQQFVILADKPRRKK